MKNTPLAAKRRLAFLFRRNGCVRLPSPTRREEGHRNYKKGWEVRLIAHDENELEQMRALLEIAGFRVAKPFRKTERWVQPIYGREACEWFSRFSPDAQKHNLPKR